MARLPRVKDLLNGGSYHIHASVGGPAGYYPLSDPLAQHKLKGLIRFYAHAYFCGVASFQLMGNHYHLVMRFDPVRELNWGALWERALRFYQNSDRQLQAWPAKKWNRLRERIFDPSEFMRNVQIGLGIVFFSIEILLWQDLAVKGIDPEIARPEILSVAWRPLGVYYYQKGNN